MPDTLKKAKMPERQNARYIKNGQNARHIKMRQNAQYKKGQNARNFQMSLPCLVPLNRVSTLSRALYLCLLSTLSGPCTTETRKY